MLLTIFLAIVFCAAITLLLILGVGVVAVYDGRKYGYNLKSQLLKLLVIFPAASALAAWICTLFQV